MRLQPFSPADIEPFLALAHQEHWIVEPWELEFLFKVFLQGCFVAIDEAGPVTGFVTAVVHQHSGWIGNLIVAGEYRHRGIGKNLFQAALGALLNAGVETVWLTASEMGRPLYERHGFTVVDSVNRWTAIGKLKENHLGEHSSLLHGACTAAKVDAEALDTEAWGDCREKLLAAVMARGRSIFAAGGFVTVQACRDRYQIGPFYALDGRVAFELLESATAVAPVGSTIFLDVPASNGTICQILDNSGFRKCGSNRLMYYGKRPSYRPEVLCALATMGSCG